MFINEFMEKYPNKQWAADLDGMFGENGVTNVWPIDLSEIELSFNGRRDMDLFGHNNGHDNGGIWYFDFEHVNWKHKKIDYGSVSPLVIRAIERYYIDKLIALLD